MLKIVVPPIEYFNEKTNEFTYMDGATLEMEHSLVSISKWEARWNKPFLSATEKTTEEIVDYIRCMVMNDVDNLDKVLGNLTMRHITEINKYIESSMTATTFTKDNSPGGREIVTSEIIYYWMLTFNIPFECQHWHLNRLLTLIRVCNIKNNPPAKMSKQEILSRNRALNQARKQQLNTRG